MSKVDLLTHYISSTLLENLGLPIVIVWGNGPFLSRRDIKIHVCKYIWPPIISQYAVCRSSLDYYNLQHGHAHSL